MLYEKQIIAGRAMSLCMRYVFTLHISTHYVSWQRIYKFSLQLSSKGLCNYQKAFCNCYQPSRMGKSQRQYSIKKSLTNRSLSVMVQLYPN